MTKQKMLKLLEKVDMVKNNSKPYQFAVEEVIHNGNTFITVMLWSYLDEIKQFYYINNELFTIKGIVNIYEIEKMKNLFF